MAQAFGYDTDFGFAEETIFGTRVVPTNWLEINTESMALTQSAIGKNVLNSAAENSYVLSKRAVAGSIEACLPFQGAEILLKHLTGGTPISTQQGATLVYNHKFVLADNMLIGLSLDLAKDADAITTSYAYSGCQISAATFVQDVESQLIVTWEFIGQDESKVAATSPTFPTANAVDWTQVSTATFNAVTVAAMVSEFKVENPLADDRYKLGSRLRKGLGRSDTRKITGKVTLEFDSITQYDLFRDSTETAIIMEWVGAIADAAEPYKFKVTVPRAVFSGTTPNAGDSGPLSMDMTFSGFTGLSAEDAITLELNNLLVSIP